MKKTKTRFVLLAIVEILLGLVFLLNPDMTMVTIAVIMGISVLTKGILDIVYYFRYKNDPYFRGSLISGILCAVLGVFLLTNAGISSVSTVLPYALAVGMIVYGVTCLNWSTLFGIYYGNINGWLAIIFGVLALLEPSIATFSVSIPLSLFLLTTGIFNLVSMHKIESVHRQIKKTVKEVNDQLGDLPPVMDATYEERDHK